MAVVREALRAARQAKKLSLEQAAREAGYKSKSGWAMVEAGVNKPDSDQMMRMADVVGLPLVEAFPELGPLIATATSEAAARKEVAN